MTEKKLENLIKDSIKEEVNRIFGKSEKYDAEKESSVQSEKEIAEQDNNKVELFRKEVGESCKKFNENCSIKNCKDASIIISIRTREGVTQFIAGSQGNLAFNIAAGELSESDMLEVYSLALKGKAMLNK